MDKGEFLDKKKQRIAKTIDKYKILSVGPVAGLSFAPICVFTGLSTSCNGIITASLSRVNLSKKNGGSKNSYYDSMMEYITKSRGLKETVQLNKEGCENMFRTIAKSWDVVPASIENGCCARFRGVEKYDIYFYGQDLYIVKGDPVKVYVKTFGKTEWIPFK